jgi:acyl-homoserine-lactone acylase
MHATVASKYFQAAVLIIAACWNVDIDAKHSEPDQARSLNTSVEIVRTTDDIPHIQAQDWKALGAGIGYVQAEDALCTLADAFVTYKGSRSWFFGADARPAYNSILGRATNLELDFFFRNFADDDVLHQYREQNPAELISLVQGFVLGYNRYLSDARAKRVLSQHYCLNQAWVLQLTEDDVYRRFYAAQIAAGYGHFVAEIVRAASTPNADDNASKVNMAAKLAKRIGEQDALGSNVLAFGPRVTGAGPVLLGNPHWYWGGPDRFYQMHLSIPGKLNVAGAAFLGVPMIMVGFNDNVAWSHTVSTARRFGFFDLRLTESDPLQYRIDGSQETLQTRTITVEVRAEHGKEQRITRKFYRSRFGPIIDLGMADDPQHQSDLRLTAIRDANAENFRVFRNYLYWNRASSLSEFVAIQRREVAVPWVNTAAIGRDSSNVWFADIGPAPNVSDALKKRCSTPRAEKFAQLDPYVPFLDGSKSGCEWLQDPAAIQSGILPAMRMPGILRHDYVANMNDSYWLVNTQNPIEGFPSVLGGERQPLSLRSQLGHRIAQQLMMPAAAFKAVPFAQHLRVLALAPRAYSAERFKHELLGQLCANKVAALAPDVMQKIAHSAGVAVEAVPKKVSLTQACDVLRKWTNEAGADDRGAVLWDAFWDRLEEIPATSLYRVAFSSSSPLDTPCQPLAAAQQVEQAFAATVALFAVKGWALNMPVRDQRFLTQDGKKLALWGGCHAAGYFAMLCGDESGRIGPNTVGNSYMQVVQFGQGAVEAYTLLAHGQKDFSLSAQRPEASIRRYAQKQWLQFPFTDSQIAQDPQLKRQSLSL